MNVTSWVAGTLLNSNVKVLMGFKSFSIFYYWEEIVSFIGVKENYILVFLKQNSMFLDVSYKYLCSIENILASVKR